MRWNLSITSTDDCLCHTSSFSTKAVGEKHIPDSLFHQVFSWSILQGNRIYFSRSIMRIVDRSDFELHSAFFVPRFRKWLIRLEISISYHSHRVPPPCSFWLPLLISHLFVFVSRVAMFPDQGLFGCCREGETQQTQRNRLVRDCVLASFVFVTLVALLTANL